MSDIYCEQIIPGNLKVNIIEETDNVLAFDHTNPYWEKHVVIIPKKHITSLTLSSEEDESMINEVMSVARKICKNIEDESGGCRVWHYCV
ncbi:HIT domain-containing protein [Bacteriovoracaceae bacterium]|nr:HIT domain-containing protein [Bacteriovoracaceae bacterium]